MRLPKYLHDVEAPVDRLRLGLHLELTRSGSLRNSRAPAACSNASHPVHPVRAFFFTGFGWLSPSSGTGGIFVLLDSGRGKVLLAGCAFKPASASSRCFLPGLVRLRLNSAVHTNTSCKRVVFWHDRQHEHHRCCYISFVC